MPAYNPPPQVLFSPVTNYYQGKAIRTQQKANEQSIEFNKLKMDVMKDELENAPSEREQAKEFAELQMDNIRSQIDERVRSGEVAELELNAKLLTPALVDYANAEDDEGARLGFNEAMRATLPNMSEESRQKYMEAAGPDHEFSHEEIMLTGLGVRAFMDKQGELKMASPNPKDFTPESWAQYAATGDSSKLRAVPDAPLVTVTNKTEGAAASAFGKAVGERASKRISQAEATLSSDAAIERARLALARGAQTGFLEETLLDIKSAGSTLFGIEFDEGDTEAEVLRKLGNEAALRLRNPESGLGLTGNTSNKDLDFLKAAVFGLQKTEGGNIKILDYMLRTNKMKRDVAGEQSRIIEGNGGEIPSNLDIQIMEYVNGYQFFNEEERVMIEALAASNSSVIERAGSLISEDEGQETYDDGTTVTWD